MRAGMCDDGLRVERAMERTHHTGVAHPSARETTEFRCARGCWTSCLRCREYSDAVAKRADDFRGDSSIEVINPETDTSAGALTAWIAELERENDWIDLPVTAAELIAQDRAARSS